ncbi:hypothetical protein LWM68_12185 [Niabella sp. W65]|nr:hypothetical protein [Niabella sp. W65]MCH7363437.1 hypothetical protein [Niabella sp. W65]
MDYVWYGKDREWQRGYAQRFQNFLRSKGINSFDDQFELDGSRPEFILQAGPVKKLRHSIGLIATAASASLMNPEKTASTSFINCGMQNCSPLRTAITMPIMMDCCICFA